MLLCLPCIEFSGCCQVCSFFLNCLVILFVIVWMAPWREIGVSFIDPWGHNFRPVGIADSSSGSKCNTMMISWVSALCTAVEGSGVVRGNEEQIGAEEQAEAAKALEFIYYICKVYVEVLGLHWWGWECATAAQCRASDWCWCFQPLLSLSCCCELLCASKNP